MTKSQKISEYVDRKWKSFQIDWMTAIKTPTKKNWTRNWDNFYAKYEEQYPTIIFYI